MKTEEKILKSIVLDKNLVKKHPGWGFYIETRFEALHMIGLIDKGNHLELSIFFGDSQSQSRAFYAADPKIELLSGDEWKMRPNFHLASAFGKNLSWFGSKLSSRDYINFWRNNSGLLFRHSIEQSRGLLNLLSDKRVIILDEEKRKELNDVIFSKDYSFLNIAAGFALIYSIPKVEFDNITDEVNLKIRQLLIEKINEGLSIIGENGSRFLIDIDSKSNWENSDDLPTSELQGDPDGL